MCELSYREATATIDRHVEFLRRACEPSHRAVERSKPATREEENVLGERRDASERAREQDDRNRGGALEQELGDVLWYLAQLATEAGLDLGQVAAANLDKLAARAARGTLHGSGDDR